MKKNSLSYYALLDKGRSPGVAKKIANTIEAADALGFRTSENIFPTTLKGIFFLARKLMTDKSSIVFVRFSDLAFPALIPIFLCLRIKRTKLVIDVPTPRKAFLREIDSTIQSPLRRLARRLWTYASGPWVMLPANLIIQYADDGEWFSIFTKRKTLKTGNGIYIDPNTPLIRPRVSNEPLVLIAVAQLAEWHGYDRLLRAIACLRTNNSDSKVQVRIVGAGDALTSLKTLAKSLKIEDQVTFYGPLTGEALNEAFNGAHVGVASLGLYRIGLNEASVLKVREYMARGLPVIGAGLDPDFPCTSPYRHTIPNTDEIHALTQTIISIEQGELPNPRNVRAFAEKNLSLKGKIQTVIKKLGIQTCY